MHVSINRYLLNSSRLELSLLELSNVSKSNARIYRNKFILIKCDDDSVVFLIYLLKLVLSAF